MEIPADQRDQLFVPFARLGAEASEVEGTGLGLALSGRLVQATGGALELQHSASHGSIFEIEHPAAAHPAAVLDTYTLAPRSTDPAAYAPATLLYIEDNLANLSLVETILLARPEWRIVPALRGQRGVELASECTPDLVLLDLHLPDISRIEVLRRLRSDRHTARIPVVVISADATQSSIGRLHAGGADAYLSKPLDVDEFLSTVERFIPVSPRHGSAQE